MAALECGVDTVLGADMDGLRAKSLALTRLFAEQVLASCPQLTLVSPAEDAQRGSQVCFSHPEMGYPVVQALIARGVIGDFRAPDILRFGFTPLYTGYADAWDAAEHLRQVLATEEWRRPEFNQRQAVT
jgi:kynureninase